MSYQNIPAGKDLPHDIYVVIEIPANSSPVKYEIDKDADALFVDRFMASPMFYPANYGYIKNARPEGNGFVPCGSNYCYKQYLHCGQAGFYANLLKQPVHDGVSLSATIP